MMKKIVKIKDEELCCLINRSSRAKYVRITVNFNRSLKLTVPYFSSVTLALRFLKEKEDWISKMLEKEKHKSGLLQKGSRKDYLLNKEKARGLIMKRIELFNAYYCYNYKRIAIRDQKTRWGSCSSLGNLNFNWRVVYLDSECVDYLVVHELCHLKEMNHSRRFWAEVGKTIPNYKEVRKRMRNL